jgi:arylsulfate sulfotransferase
MHVNYVGLNRGMKLKVTIFLSLFVALNVLLNPFLWAAGSKATQKKNNGNKVPPRFSPGPSSSAIIGSQSPGTTPFIALINATVSPANSLKTVQFTITPAPGSVTRPISATYTANYLQSRNYLNTGTGAAIIPVFGLYANFSNTVTLNFSFTDGSSQQNMVQVVTADWTDTCGVYKNPTVLQARTNTTNLSYDYMMVKSACDSLSPTIIDTDGVVRWVGTAGSSSLASIFFANGIYISTPPPAGSTPTGISRIEFDGIVTFVHDYSNINVTSTGHHNIDPGRQGMLVDVNTTSQTESVILEIDTAGNVLNTWNFANIISAAMTAGGDDPTQFVFPAPTDWFHNNAATYRKSDNTLIASSRENFVIAVDYDTQQIKWILGDHTKKWYVNFASLRAFALNLGPNSLPPIGQHAVSITNSDNLLLFDDGFQSTFQMPAGTSHNPSLARKYQLDLGAMTATEVWNYNQNLFSNVCSSVYEEPGLDYLVDWAHLSVSGGNAAELVGLDNGSTKVFDYRYPTTSCNTAWNSIPIHLEQMTFTSVIPLRAVSRLTHGSAGTYDVSLPLTGTPAIECRSGGGAGNYQVVVTFATTPVSVTGASVTSDSGGTASVSGAPAISGKDVAVNLTGVSNAQTLTVNLLGVSDGTNTDDISVRVSILQGDTTGNGIVNSSDISQTQSQSGQPVTGANFREDVTASGQINSSDINFVQSKSGSALP